MFHHQIVRKIKIFDLFVYSIKSVCVSKMRSTRITLVMTKTTLLNEEKSMGLIHLVAKSSFLIVSFGFRHFAPAASFKLSVKATSTISELSNPKYVLHLIKSVHWIQVMIKSGLLLLLTRDYIPNITCQ